VRKTAQDEGIILASWRELLQGREKLDTTPAK
jgi:hypothetical protein